jgi:8-oxo-dGTP pyrophosphatase MutT (NUDIX family)
VEQFRHGSETIELEVPGGVRDAADASPVETAVRELREETGFEGVNPRVIGDIWPNPAIQSNRCFTILIENCGLKHPVDLDHGEDLVTHIKPATEMPHLVAQGRIRHSLVIVALYHFELWQRGLKSDSTSSAPIT